LTFGLANPKGVYGSVNMFWIDPFGSQMLETPIQKVFLDLGTPSGLANLEHCNVETCSELHNP